MIAGVVAVAGAGACCWALNRFVGGGEYAGDMRWSEFAADEQVLAAAAHDQLVKPGVVLAGTTRRDGSARISGVEPLIMDGDSRCSPSTSTTSLTSGMLLGAAPSM
jgi:hypothetical protein